MSLCLAGKERQHGLRVASAIQGILLLLASLAQAQSQASTVEGTVLDGLGHAISGAMVYLAGPDAQTLSSGCDLKGAYRFSALRPGSYSVQVSTVEYGEKAFGPFALGENEIKRIDFTLPAATSSEAKAEPNPPEFFDPPQFTVAGVRDASGAGGHGSNPIFRTTEGLVKATTVLGESKESPNSSSLNAASEKSLRDAVEHAPHDFDANYKLGKWLVDSKRPQEAVPYLEGALRLNPEDADAGYELALAYAGSGDYPKARTRTEYLLRHRPQDARLYELIADVEEKTGEPLEAVRAYQMAAELNPSETNLFSWGSELLLHQAAEPAAELFRRGHQSYPGSVRMLIGLGVASYSRGFFEEANQRLAAASDLNPRDPVPYLFLGKIQAVEVTPSPLVEEKLERFVRLQPNNALANYYYAVSLRRRRSGPQDVKDSAQAELLLQKAVELDPTLGLAYLELGVLYEERKEVSRAIAAYQKAIVVSPRLEEAHYRLAQLYRLTGENEKAREELRAFEQIKKATAQQAERERAEIRQFVYTLRDPSSAVQPQ
jgi:tetratricopeptide (TPR) repeat protein